MATAVHDPDLRESTPPVARTPGAFPAPRNPWASRSLLVLASLASIGALKLGQTAIVPVLFALFLALGGGTAATMYWLDMPSPLLWGVVAFALNFIPYAGSATRMRRAMAARMSSEACSRRTRPISAVA